MSDNVVPIEKASSVQEQAAQWLVEMDYRTLDREETAELKAWLAVSPEHQRVFRETALVYGQADVLQVLADLQPLDANPADSTVTAGGSGPYSARWNTGGWAVAASVVLTLALFLGLAAGRGFFGGEPRQPLAYATEVGGRKVVELIDGSTLTLNTDTALRLGFTDSQRRVMLERGEAFFSVAHDTARPFVVDTGEGLVTAVGTAFSVYKREADVEVAVTEGRVRVQAVPESAQTKQQAPSTETKADGTVSGAAESPVLNKVDTEALVESGQVVTFNRRIERVETVAPEKLSRRLFWQQGMLAFEGESLQEVVDQFSRYTTLEISIEDPALKTIAVDGYFKSDDVAGMLNSLRLNFGIEVVRADENRILLKRS